MSSIESEMNVKQTQAFIDAAPEYITMERWLMVADGAGGTVPTTQDDVRTERVRPVGQRRPPVITTPDGRQVQVDLSLVALPNIDAQIGDVFSFGERDYEVVQVQDQPKWRTIVEAIRRG